MIALKMRHLIAMLIDVELVNDEAIEGVPDEANMALWAIAAVKAAEPANSSRSASLVVKVVNERESQLLNEQYRNKTGPTNILSFSLDLPDEVMVSLDQRPLGDLVVCAPLVAAEASEQKKPADHHWAHLIVHGVLHLLGYDHLDEDQARVMENLERIVLQGFSVPDPYLAHD